MRILGVLSTAFLGFLLPFHANAQTPGPMNVIVVMTDDLSELVMDTLLSEARLPNTQQYLIDEGVRFENAYVTNSLCCPSKATFLRGQYTKNHGVFSNRFGPDQFGIKWPGWLTEGAVVGKEDSTIATWLRDAGYHTGHIGRYLNGYGLAAPTSEPDPQLYIPPGWDEWYGLIEPQAFQMYDYLLNENGSVVTYGNLEADYQTDVLAGLAVKFIEERAAGGEPFFLNLWTAAPHTEYQSSTIRPAPRHLDLIDGNAANDELPVIVGSLTPAFNELDVTDKPSCVSFATPATPKLKCVGDLPPLTINDISILNAQFRGMMASMLAVDDLIGAIMNALTASGLADNTAILFTSDNGWSFGFHRHTGKDLPYEESIGIPLLIRAPGLAGGATAAQLALNNDLAPTIAELANVTPPYVPDGVSLVPLLMDPTRSDWHRKMFLIEHYFIAPGQISAGLATFRALRRLTATNNYLYVATHADPQTPPQVTHREFYDLAKDPNQLSSFDLPSETDDLMDSILNNLKTCAGANCKTRESL
jgi:arylsulfatase A-like enzyme